MKARHIVSGALLAMALAGCEDHEGGIVSPSPQPGGPGRVIQLGSQPASWRGYWRDTNNLWIYDQTTEVGINAVGVDAARRAAMASMGMRMVRYGIHWNRYLADPNCTTGYEYACGLEFAVAEAAANGVELLVGIENDDCTTAPCPYTASANNIGYLSVPRQVFNEAFAGFMTKLARQYPTVKFWQAWNEPDGGWHGIPYFAEYMDVCPANSSQIHRAQQGRNYRAFLGVVYDSIQQLNASTGNRRWLLTAGMTGGVPGPLAANGTEDGVPCPGRSEPQFEFLRAMYENNGRADFDLLAMHAYDRGAYYPGGVIGKLNSVQSILNEVGDANRPVWVTEFSTDATNTSNRGRDLILADSALWRGQFDQAQRTYFEQALGYQDAYGAANKMFVYHMASPEGGMFTGVPVTHSFGPDYGDDDWRNFGVGIFRVHQGSTLENLANPRPSAEYLQLRAGQNSQPGIWDANGGRAAPYNITTFASIPNDVPFQYQGTNLPTLLSIGPITVKTLHPTEVKFFAPFVATPYVRNVGWMYSVYNNMVAGYETQPEIMELLKVEPFEAHPGMPALCVQAHSSTVGWSGYNCGGGPVGTLGYQLEALQMTFSGASAFTVCYQTHSHNPAAPGWSNWGCDGETAGTTGLAAGVGAVRIRIHRKPDRSFGNQ